MSSPSQDADAKASRWREISAFVGSSSWRLKPERRRFDAIDGSEFASVTENSRKRKSRRRHSLAVRSRPYASLRPPCAKACNIDEFSQVACASLMMLARGPAKARGDCKPLHYLGQPAQHAHWLRADLFRVVQCQASRERWVIRGASASLVRRANDSCEGSRQSASLMADRNRRGTQDRLIWLLRRHRER